MLLWIYYFALKIAFLLALIRSAVKFEPLQDRPVFLAVLATAGVGFLSWVFVVGGLGYNQLKWEHWLVSFFLLTWLYFWLLKRCAETGFAWWVILLSGAVGLIYF
jgi:hypothetical protein